ncbi:hypothetical protein EV668_3174 [Enterovirga rhinocerotis]|uniref:Uncharacterized protein n=1 Tax=Enterovirga rhinocerotis TaxID=1339210 RepID=A0A4R7C1Q5_9HYPH|nr:hypothetical protein EV668_3174 [Enterovirga rhinocerotis]
MTTPAIHSDPKVRPKHRRDDPPGVALPSLGVSSLDCGLPSGVGRFFGSILPTTLPSLPGTGRVVFSREAC